MTAAAPENSAAPGTQSLPGRVGAVQMLVVGLHITKCAGTTLALHVRAQLPPKRWYLCSGFRDMQELGYLEFAERLNIDEMRFVFGHFVHESLFSVAGERPLFLFTGIRAPVERAISEFHHISKIRRRASRNPPSPDEFFSMRKNTMCFEILRAFPSLAASARGSLSERAIQVSQMFDFIYDTVDFETSVQPLLKLMNIRNEDMRAVNVRETETGAGTEDIAAAEAELRARCPEFFDQDEALFRFLQPKTGKLRPFAGDNGAASAYRKRWEADLRSREGGFDVLTAHFARHVVADYRNLGRLDELATLMERKQRWLDLLKSFAGTPQHGQ